MTWRAVPVTRWGGLAGVVGVTSFLGVVTVLHAVRRDLSPIDDLVSDYANGRWGGLFTLGVLAHGAGNIALSVGLARALGRSGAARLGVVTFALASVGLLVTGVFRTDAPGAPESVAGVVHRSVATASFAVELAALLVLASAFRASPAWRSYARRAVALTALAGGSTAWLVVALRTGWAPGLAERAALAAFALWELSTAARLARAAPPSGGRPPG